MTDPAETLDKVLASVAKCNLPMMLMKRHRKLRLKELQIAADTYERAARALRDLIREVRGG